ncbi:MAG: HAD-IIIA family hydrolase [Deltaproteobacteria bacterium]|nr:HAD-IIIA family hydrolase [Deltaproteobacteria bacterium]
MAEIAKKIRSREECARLVAEGKSRGQRVGFTSGSFDLIHPGHVLYLNEAKKHCDLLVVGLNSDHSIQTYKSKLRPVMPEQDRLIVLSAMESVDLVFLFDETNNNSNIEVLKPDIYIKAGDYDKASLSSAPLVEAYGGEVLLVPFEKGHSTSSIIARITELSKAQDAGCIDLEPPPRRPAVFIDRDGTIVEFVEYLHEPEKLRVLPGALEGMKLLQQAGFRIVIITNQPGIGMGFYTKEDFYRVNRELLRAASKAGVLIDKVYFCPHSKAEQCLCRKPATALVERANKELNLDLSGSYVIGDMTIDLMLAKNAGCTPVLVRTGYGGQDGLYPATPEFTGEDLAQAAAWILDNHTKP